VFFHSTVASPQKAAMKLDAFTASENLFRPVTAARLHGLDVKDSTSVCEHFLNFGRFLFEL